jgi:DMSO/TMAO reductase YedYZ molybdopterin-dependent catalytic subunit
MGRRAVARGLWLAAGAAIVGILLAACASVSPTGVEELAPVEIEEYQGADLSSIADFQENSIKGPQYVNLEDYRLKVDGLVEVPLEYTLEEAAGSRATHQKVVTLHCVEGWSVNILWEGVLVEDLIGEAKALPGANTVIFHAYDGYTTSLPLDYIMGQDIMLAFRMNGVDLPPERGAPFQLVAESKWGYKWIKWVTRIELSDDVNYEGYWEGYGYSNDGDL